MNTKHIVIFLIGLAIVWMLLSSGDHNNSPEAIAARNRALPIEPTSIGYLELLRSQHVGEQNAANARRGSPQRWVTPP